jgi:C4-dicarboxylate-specific signal transduction histidine kinase
MPEDVMRIWIENYQLSLKNHQPISFEYAHPLSQETRWVAATVAPVFFKDSFPPRCAYVAQDITERKTMENQVRSHAEELEKEVERRTTRIQELEQRRMQVEKLAALAQIAAGVAHEINNPLASISQSLVLLKRAIPTEHPHYRYMAKVEDCIDRIAKITKHLYQLYRPSSPTPMPVDLCLCIRTAAEIMQERSENHRVQINFPMYLQPIITHASQGELIQVLCNLIHNAIDTSPPDSTIEVSLVTGRETLSIFVADQGEGIGPEDTPHIFQPFYTTKNNQAEGGMGLGLSISHSLVESMGGTLDFTTEIGHGSTFRITLPLTTTQ